MHTAICAFDDGVQAERAVDELVRAGFARHDVHIEHRDLHERHLRGGRGATDQWDGLEREVAVDPGVVARFGHFFDRLFGRERHPAYTGTYAGHVERGGYVVVVDGPDDAQAERARAILQGLQARDLNTVHRADQRPLRDVVAMRQEESMAGSTGTAGMVEHSREPYEGWSNATSSNMESERAMAAPLAPRTGPELRDPDVEHAPGLRYADKDKPIG